MLTAPPSPRVPDVLVHPYTEDSLLAEAALYSAAWSGAAAWPEANLAMYVPFAVPVPRTISKLGAWIATSAGNLDIGIYNPAWTRLVSLGSTASPGTGVREFDITDLTLARGYYYLALACDGVTIAFRRGNPSTLFLPALGMAQESAAFPLPATVTPARIANAYIPSVLAAYRSLVE